MLGGCLLSVVCWLLFVAWCVVGAVCCEMCVARAVLFVVRRLVFGGCVCKRSLESCCFVNVAC